MVATDRQLGNPYIGGKLLYCIDPHGDRWLLAYDLKKVEAEGQAEAPELYTYLTREFDHRPSLEEVAQLVADDAIKVEIAHTYSLTVEQVRAAYTELAKGHVRGKLVVDLS